MIITFGCYVKFACEFPHSSVGFESHHFQHFCHTLSPQCSQFCFPVRLTSSSQFICSPSVWVTPKTCTCIPCTHTEDLCTGLESEQPWRRIGVERNCCGVAPVSERREVLQFKLLKWCLPKKSPFPSILRVFLKVRRWRGGVRAVQLRCAHLVWKEGFDLGGNGIKIPADVVGQEAGWKKRESEWQKEEGGSPSREKRQGCKPKIGRDGGGWGVWWCVHAQVCACIGEAERTSGHVSALW